MPRYKFSWERLPGGLLRALQRDLDLEGDTAVALRKAFGARPSEEFVRAAWPTLRETWLTKDRASRLLVVEHLRDRRLGDLTIGTRNAADQLAYLRSCRNGVTLRGIVLQALLPLGSEAAVTPAQQPKPPREPVVSKPSRDPVVSKAWPTFVSQLAASLSALEEDQYLVITRKDRPWFVQFAAQGAFGVRAELVSNSYLEPDERLSDAAIEAALALGWQRPTITPNGSTAELDPDGSPNYFREWEQPVAFIDVARVAADTLTKVLGTSHPAMLSYSAFASDGSRILLPGLGLKCEPVEVVDQAGSSLDAPSGLDAPAVTQQLLEVLRELSGNAELDVDGDGDIPLRYGSAMVFVHVFGEPPVVQVFSQVLADADVGVDLTQAVSDLNTQHLFVKWTVRDTSVVASVDLFGDPLTAQHVLHACGVLGEAVDGIDERLRDQFGGRTFFGEYAPPKLRTDAGYL